MNVVKYLIPFISIITTCWGQIPTDTIIIHNTRFIFQEKTLKSEYNHMDTLVYVYRVENGQKKYLLKHYTYRFAADCNNEFIDKGAYTIQSDTIIFTTRYLQNLSDPIPLRRKQIYVVKPTGKLILIKDVEQDYEGVWRNTASTGNLATCSSFVCSIVRLFNCSFVQLFNPSPALMNLAMSIHKI